MIFLLLTLRIKADVPENVGAAIKAGNPKEIAAFFIENVDLKVIDKEMVCSRQQAEAILKNFFDKHNIKTFVITHKGDTKNGSQYVISKMETSSGNYRVYFLIKTVSNKQMVQQFRIENE